MRVKYKYMKRKWLWLTVDARKIDLASISSVVLLSHREFLKLLLFLYEFERIKTNMNWLLIFWSYFSNQNLRKTNNDIFPGFPVAQSLILSFHGCRIVNCKQPRLQFSQQQIASRCVIETRTSKPIFACVLERKRSTISLSRGYFACWLLSIALYSVNISWNENILAFCWIFSIKKPKWQK